MQRLAATFVLFAGLMVGAALAQGRSDLVREFPSTDFATASVDLDELRFDGARRDSITPIHQPRFEPVGRVVNLGIYEPVISVVLNGDARAYPLRILLWHEIVNDTVGGVPLLISYCPLCNSGVVFDRRVNGDLLTFGNTGRIRHFDMVMYDQQTESFWQQFTGEAIVGSLTGARMKAVPARLESFDAFRRRMPDGLLLVPADPGARRYGYTPFAGMDRIEQTPRALAGYDLPDGLSALSYVIAVDNRAWPLERVRKARRLTEEGITFEWRTGRNSLHDQRKIRDGRDLGIAIVADSAGREMVYDVTFAFAFSAFHPDGIWMLGD